MRTASSRSTARACACRRSIPWWCGRPRPAGRRSARVGLKDVIGSWKTTASEVPSSRRGAGVSVGPQVGAEKPSRSARRRGRAPRRAGRRPAPSATCPSPTRRRCRGPRRGGPRTTRRAPAGPARAGRGRRRRGRGPRAPGRGRRPASVADSPTGPRLAPRPAGAAAAGSRAIDADAQALGDRLADQVEREPGEDHRERRARARRRVDVDRPRPSLSSRPQSYWRLLDAEPEERQPGEGEQRAARRRSSR